MTIKKISAGHYTSPLGRVSADREHLAYLSSIRSAIKKLKGIT